MFFTIEGAKSFDVSTSNSKTLIVGINLYVFPNILGIQLLKKIILSAALTSTIINLWLKSDSQKNDSSTDSIQTILKTLKNAMIVIVMLVFDIYTFTHYVFYDWTS